MFFLYQYQNICTLFPKDPNSKILKATKLRVENKSRLDQFDIEAQETSNRRM
jgi:hypothetical protein